MLEKEKNPPNPKQNLNKPLPLTHTTTNQGDGTVQFYIQNIISSYIVSPESGHKLEKSGLHLTIFYLVTN